MSILQEQAVQMISNLSDDNVSFLIEIIQRLMPQKSQLQASDILTDSTSHKESRKAFDRLEAARTEIHQYLPEDFNPDKELKEAKEERYGSIG
ncbi:MAG: hypothetical protein K2H40_05265 [Lachnospiraceae bacterium]|nr:hypothetical protein [Lachnospiraceae bacterium]